MNAKYLSMLESRQDGACLLCLSGRIDSTNAEELIARIRSLLEAGEKRLILDFGELVYLTSAAFRALLLGMDECKRHGATLVLCRMTTQVRELFEMVALLDVFTVCASREDALAM